MTLVKAVMVALLGSFLMSATSPKQVPGVISFTTLSSPLISQVNRSFVEISLLSLYLEISYLRSH